MVLAQAKPKRNRKTQTTVMPKKAHFTNYVAFEIGGNAYPQLHCPVCGKGTTEPNEQCPHLLFVCGYQGCDGKVAFNYAHPRFNKTTDAMEEEFFGTRPIDLAAKLRLDPENTMVLCVTYLFSSPSFTDLVEVAVGIEFPAVSKEFKVYKKSLSEAS